MVGIHAYALNGRRFWINQLPAFAAIRTAPQFPGSRIYRLRIMRIKREELDDSTEIEHPPSASAVVRNVRTCHIARDQHGVRIVRAYRGMEHRAAATGPNHLETAGTIQRGG